MESKKSFIPFDKISDYIYEVDKHYTELTLRQRKVRQDQIDPQEAHQLNTQSLLKFHEFLTNYLKSFNIKIPTQETNIEQISDSVTMLSNQIKTFDEVKQSIVSAQNSGENNKLNELIEQLEGSSKSIQDAFLEINSQISNLKAAQQNEFLRLNSQIINNPQEEEVKQSEVKAESFLKLDQKFEQLMTFYNDLDNLKQKDYQLQSNIKHQIVHPYKVYKEDTPYDKMEKVQVILQICTLWNGVPHGIAIIKFKHSYSEGLSFTGVGVFNHGQLHNSPFTCVTGNYWGVSFTNMMNGRPADLSYYTQFYKDWRISGDCLKLYAHLSGQQYYSGQVDKERRWNGVGKRWEYEEGEKIYVGGFKNDKRTQGREYKKDTNTLFEVEYDQRGNCIKRKEISGRHQLD